MHNLLHLATAIEAVLQAGAIQMTRFHTEFEVSKKGDIDLVTEVDVAVEEMFRRMIAERFPGHAVLAEELGDLWAGPEPPPYCWVFDPIDGTTNFTHGLPIFCSSLALELDGQPIVAAVYDPARRELFTAERGGGAFLNGAPLRVSKAATLFNALLVTGFPYDVHRTVEEVVGLFGAFVTRARAVRRLGSAALDLCYIAAGRMDGFWEQQLRPWDMSAGALIVAEAGGTVTGFAGAPFSSRRPEIVASNGLIHQEMLATIEGFFAGRSRNRTE